MKKSFLKLIVHSIILCFGMASLLSIPNYYAVEDNDNNIVDNNSENTNNNSENESSQTSENVNNSEGNKREDNNNSPDTQKKPESSESISKSTKKVLKNKKAKSIKENLKPQVEKVEKEEKKVEETAQQVLLPEISFEDLNLGNNEKVENLKQEDKNDKILKGAVSWGLILLGIVLIIFVIINNKKIPCNLDIKNCNKHAVKSKKRKKYYKHIQRRS